MDPWRGSSSGCEGADLKVGSGCGCAGVWTSPESHTARFFHTDNTAAVHTQHVGFNRQEQDVFLLPILVVDSGPPTLSSTGTLTIRICGCDSSGTIQSCNTTAFVMAASLSPGALIALLVCVLILVGEFMRIPPLLDLGILAQIDHSLGREPQSPLYNNRLARSISDLYLQLPWEVSEVRMVAHLGQNSCSAPHAVQDSLVFKTPCIAQSGGSLLESRHLGN